MSQPKISVIVVSDYAAGGAKSWKDLRGTLTALAQQDVKEQVEWLLCENRAYANEIPGDFIQILPSLKLVLSEASGSYELKNAGVQAASSELVAILDADCVPDTDWLRNALAAMRSVPNASVISGRTVYAATGLTERILALLSRSYVDRGKSGPTRFISNNNSVWRREVYLGQPLPGGLGPFAGRIQSEGILRAGHLLWFEPSIRVVHDFEGWPMESDIRRNAGYGTVIARLHDPHMPQAWLTRLGVAAIPVFVGGKIIDSWRDCLRCATVFGLKRFQIPLALLYAVGVHVMEAPGMWHAFRRKVISVTSYR
jgi:glycosyltransferase involved in cell wall biosynthesis